MHKNTSQHFQVGQVPLLPNAHVCGRPWRQSIYNVLRRRNCHGQSVALSPSSTTPTRPDCRETRVYDPVSDKVRLGPLGFPTNLRTLSGRRLVRSISDFVSGSGRVADKVRGSVQWNLETTRPDPTSEFYELYLCILNKVHKVQYSK